jgi:hypothetical protein
LDVIRPDDNPITPATINTIPTMTDFIMLRSGSVYCSGGL